MIKSEKKRRKLLGPATLMEYGLPIASVFGMEAMKSAGGPDLESYYSAIGGGYTLLKDIPNFWLIFSTSIAISGVFAGSNES